jgi:hypothetical protein
MQITEKTIESVLDQLYDSDETKAAAIMEEMSKEQPVILSYIMQMSEEFEHPDERETLIFLAVLVWKSFKTAFGNLASVSEEAMKNAEDRLFKKMEDMEKSGNMTMHVQTEVQPVLMGCIAEEVFANKPENLNAVEYKTVAVHLTSLQVVTDALQATLT